MLFILTSQEKFLSRAVKIAGRQSERPHPKKTELEKGGAWRQKTGGILWFAGKLYKKPL